jgi:hypothetical protein
LSKKKKKTLIIISVLGVLALLIGVFFIGRISVKDKLNGKDKSLGLNNDGNNQQRVNYLFLIDDYYAFNNVFSDIPREDWNMFYISKNHPRIKELLREGKLQESKKKQFIIRYERADEKNEKGGLFFNEFNQELKIIEA